MDSAAVTMETERKGKRGISGSTLKLIAITAMLIDHIGAGILERLMVSSGYMEIMLSGDVNAIIGWLSGHSLLFYGNMVMRLLIGRIAFPIFCFLLVEGFQKTHDVKKYAVRLGIFALVSELPFDLLFNSSPLEFGYQNVFFTLFVGVLVMILYDAISRKGWHTALKVALDIVVLAAGMALAEFLRTDYAALGVLCISVMYFLRRRKVLQAVGASAVLVVGNISELCAPLGFIPICLYNGTRGLKMKYFFYLFYPIHILIIYAVCVLMGIQGVVIR